MSEARPPPACHSLQPDRLIPAPVRPSQLGDYRKVEFKAF